MFTKEEIEGEIAELEEALKTASPMEYGRLEASRRVWLGRLVTWKAGGYKNEEPEPDQDEAEDAPMEGSELKPKPKQRHRRK
jgi:hypothetical protein